jgi:hypothetical protein
MSRRFDILREIEALDPERDHQRIVHLSFGYEFPAFGFPKPLPLTRPLLRASLKLRGAAVRWLPPRRTPHFFTDNRNRTYPDGYRISGLGPPRLVAAEKRREKAEVL